MLKFHPEKTDEINGKISHFKWIFSCMQFIDYLVKKLYDPEDRVRGAVIGLIKTLVVEEKNSFVLVQIKKQLLEEIAARTKDKRVCCY
jgi:hypothetical protein